MQLISRENSQRQTLLIGSINLFGMRSMAANEMTNPFSILDNIRKERERERKKVRERERHTIWHTSICKDMDERTPLSHLPMMPTSIYV
jgi:hypothetical protein